MDLKQTAMLALLLALPVVGSAADDRKGCDTVNFGEDVLAKFPNASRACRGVMEKDGMIYARYVAKVVSNDKKNLTVVFEDHAGKGVSKVTFAPAADSSLMVNGKSKKYSELQKGDVVDVWIPHSRWGLYGTPGGPKMTVVSQENM